MRGFFASSTVQKKKPDGGLIAKCGACGLYKGCETPKMAVHGQGAKGVLLIGEAPSKEDDQMGRPFMGKEGGMLRQALAEIGVDLDRDAWATNSLICKPSKHHTPDAKQISYCRPNIIQAIRELEPNVVVTLGRSALVSVLADYWKDVEQLDRWVGWTIPVERHWICPTYHPSYLQRMRNSLLDRRFSDHLEKAFSLTSKPPVQEDLKSKVEVVFDEDKAVEAIREIDREGGWAAVDYETNCLKPEWPEGKACSFAISNGERTISYLWAGRAIEETGKFLKSKRTRKIASNLKMEERWTLHLFGHGVRCWGWDTMVAAHCLDNRPAITSLKYQAFIHMGIPRSAYNETIEPYFKSQKGPYNRIHEIDPTELLRYGGLDALLEYRLAMLQRKEMGYED